MVEGPAHELCLAEQKTTCKSADVLTATLASAAACQMSAGHVETARSRSSSSLDSRRSRMGQSPSRSVSPTEPSMPARDAYREPVHYPEPYRESPSSHGYEHRVQQSLAPPFGRSPPQDQYNQDTAPLVSA